MELKKIQGYTLIELIIVIGLMVGLTTVMLLNGSGSRNLARLDSAARQLESTLSEAQAYGNSGRAYPPGSGSSGDFDKGYGVYVEVNSNKIILYGGMGGTNSPGEEKYASGRGQEYETITLEGAVKVSVVRGLTSAQNATQGHILFRRGQSKVHTYTQNQTVQGLRITLASGGVEKKVVVYETGLMYIE